jgi:hypothetical protein
MSNVVTLRPTAPEAVQAEPYLAFSNPGVLDINLVKLLGVSVKDSDSAIGFFGTGLKYAIASTLRLGGEIVIFSGGERYDVAGEKLTLRDKEFTRVTINGEPLGFTTELGKQWEPWMVVRELYSNALDENGDTMIDSAPISEGDFPGRTVIILRGECFLSVWENRQNYFLSQTEARVHTSRFVNAFDALGHNHAVFYRGIKVFDTKLPTLYRYNILDKVDLTEDRTLKYEFQLKEAVEKSIITSNDTDYISACLTAGEYTFEGYLGFSSTHSNTEMSDEFKSICRKLKERRPRNLNMSAVRWYDSRVKTFLPMTLATLTRVQQAQLDKAIAFIKQIGFADELGDYPVQVVNWLGEGIYGMAEDGTIRISKECFDKGTKFLASTLLEELVHCHYGLYDETRSMQTWLFDRIITMGEEYVSGEPL